jgi:hypothetical protein
MEKLKLTWDRINNEYVCLAEFTRYTFKKNSRSCFTWTLYADGKEIHSEHLPGPVYYSEINDAVLLDVERYITKHYMNRKDNNMPVSQEKPDETLMNNYKATVDALHRIMELARKQNSPTERYIFLDARDILRQLNETAE